MSIKWIGAIFIICGCGYVGFSMGTTFRKEEKELRSLISALDYMSCELQYRITPLPTLCRVAGQERTGYVGKLLLNLASELESQISPDVESCLNMAVAATGFIPKRLSDAVIILGSSLGRFDLQGQLQGLEAVRSFCRAELDAMVSGRDARLRSYQTLGLCAGAALAILLV